MLKFLCIIPMPPDFAIAIAISDSVTVSIAEDKNGTFNFIVSLIFVEIFTSEGSTSEKRGSKSTSSKVNASFIASI